MNAASTGYTAARRKAPTVRPNARVYTVLLVLAARSGLGVEVLQVFDLQLIQAPDGATGVRKSLTRRPHDSGGTSGVIVG
jgi:hypothetical protein